MTATMQLDDWTDKFHAARRERCVMTRDELRAAFEDGHEPESVARASDDLLRYYENRGPRP